MRIQDLAAGLRRRLQRVGGRSARAAAGTAILAGGMMFAGTAHAQLFSEDFEGLALMDTISETETAGEAVWTDVPPAGWTRDNTTTPDNGVPEFFGWTFVNKEWWISTGGQDRNAFTLGTNTVAVADGDEYDDLNNPLGGASQAMNVFMQTPAISLAGVAPESLLLNFDSSFRPYEAQTGLVDVSFDGGTTFSNVFTIDTATTPGGTSSLSRANEEVSLPLNNPAGASDLIVRFGYTNADNDWWWAIDNVVVATPDQLTLSLEVDGDGTLSVANRTSEPVYMDYYEIESPSDSLSLADWSSFQDQGNLPGFPSGNGTGNGWEEGGNLDDGVLSESYLTGMSVLQPGESVSLGMAYNNVQDGEDLVFRYGDVPVETGSGESVSGDYDGNGTVGPEDYDAWVAQFGDTGPDLAADGNGDGTVGPADYTVFRNNFGSTGGGVVATGPSVLTEGFVVYLPPGGAASNLDGAPIPEPASIIVSGMGLLLGSGFLSRRRQPGEH